MERPRTPLGSPLPVTPKNRQNSKLSDLLHQFGSQSSPSSVTKARRVLQFSQNIPEREAADDSLDKRTLSQRPSYSLSDSSNSFNNRGSSYSSILSVSRHPQQEQKQGEGGSEDHLRQSVILTPPQVGIEEELKMDIRQKKSDGPRRSSRKHSVLTSDTIMSPTKGAKKAKKTGPKAIKPDTARARLREDIAANVKAKMNNFLLVNKQYFLPLLPQQNYIARLAAEHEGKHLSTVKYEELITQPKGVTGKMKPYQISGLSFLVYLHRNGMSGLLGDEMGLGKTLQTLSLFQFLEEQDDGLGEELCPYLVICPLSVLNSWVEEAQRWVPNLKVLRFHGTPQERQRLKKVALGVEDRYGNETQYSKDRKAIRKLGTKVERLPTTTMEDQSYKIIVTTYEAFQVDHQWFKRSFLWRYVVLDEGHRIKSNSTQISNALQGVSSQYRLILTGTPIQNDLREMWSLLHWLYADVFPLSTVELFKDSFDLSRGKVSTTVLDSARHLLELVMLRRMKNSPGVDLALPPKNEILVYVPLSPMQRFWYKRLITRTGKELLEDLFKNSTAKEKSYLDEEKKEAATLDLLSTDRGVDSVSGDQGNTFQDTSRIMMKALKEEQYNDKRQQGAWRQLQHLVMQLRKCCSHPYLLPNALPEDYQLDKDFIYASGKFIFLEKLIKDLVLEKDKKVLIFSCFTKTLDCCCDLLDLAGKNGALFRYLRLDGNVSRARRNLDIRMFNRDDSNYRAMLLSVRAGGLGLNLQAATEVIFLDEDWNPQITLQAEARAHRIGQTKPVTIYKICTQGTVEEQMLGRIRKKLYLSTKITETMRNVHSGAGSKLARAQDTSANDLPPLDTSQLMTLVRRGAYALARPEIDVYEMVNWDLETMLEKCRDKPSDPIVITSSNDDGSFSDVEETRWLSAMERVECVIWEGQRLNRNKREDDNDHLRPKDVKRVSKKTTVTVDGYEVNAESLLCADWEAVPTLAGKDPSLSNVKREKKRQLNHQNYCLDCFGSSGEIVQCAGCPRVFHFDCLDAKFQQKARGWSGFYCPQHECCDCAKKSNDAGGLIYRCRSCPKGFCEDCLDWEKVVLVGDNIPEYEAMKEPENRTAFYVKCQYCVDKTGEEEELKTLIETLECHYKDDSEPYKEQMKNTSLESNASSNLPAPRKVQSVQYLENSEVGSPPALTDTSFPTPAMNSRVSTPKFQFQTPGLNVSTTAFVAKEGLKDDNDTDDDVIITSVRKVNKTDRRRHIKGFKNDHKRSKHRSNVDIAERHHRSSDYSTLGDGKKRRKLGDGRTEK